MKDNDNRHKDTDQGTDAPAPTTHPLPVKLLGVQELHLVDKQDGKTLARLGSVGLSPRLEMFDVNSGVLRLLVGLLDGEPGMIFYNDDGKPRFVARVNDGRADFGFYRDGGFSGLMLDCLTEEPVDVFSSLIPDGLAEGPGGVFADLFDEYADKLDADDSEAKADEGNEA